MKNITKYIIGALLIFLLILAAQNWFQKKKIDRQKDDIERLKDNQEQLLAEKASQTNLILTKNEFITNLSIENEKLLKQLKIKPKEVIKYVEKTVTQIDTEYVELDPMQKLDYTWEVVDSTLCWTWKGEVETFKDYDSITVSRTYFDYHNKITDVGIRKLKWKFLFIKVYDKKKIDVRSVAKCGGAVTREINIIKK
jgi:hypothetical protein